MLSIAACSYEAPKNQVTLTVDQTLPLPVSDGSKSVDVTIYRDRYGVPQVFADSNYGVYFGYGYSVARDRLFQMEMLKRTAQGACCTSPRTGLPRSRYQASHAVRSSISSPASE